MRGQWTKERVLFFVAIALALCALVKLGLVLAQRPEQHGAPTTSPVTMHRGDKDIEGALAPARPRSGGVDPFARRTGPRAEEGPAEGPDGRKAPEADGPMPPGGGDDGGGKQEGGDDDGPGPGPVAGKGATKAGDTTLGPRPPLRPPYALVAIVQVEGPPPRRQAVLRHEPTGTLRRVYIGELLDDLRLEEIGDDSVLLVDPAGRRHTLRGRFATAYGP